MDPASDSFLSYPDLFYLKIPNISNSFECYQDFNIIYKFLLHYIQTSKQKVVFFMISIFNL